MSREANQKVGAWEQNSRLIKGSGYTLLNCSTFSLQCVYEHQSGAPAALDEHFTFGKKRRRFRGDLAWSLERSMCGFKLLYCAPLAAQNVCQCRRTHGPGVRSKSRPRLTSSHLLGQGRVRLTACMVGGKRPEVGHGAAVATEGDHVIIDLRRH